MGVDWQSGRSSLGGRPLGKVASEMEMKEGKGQGAGQCYGCG